MIEVQWIYDNKLTALKKNTNQSKRKTNIIEKFKQRMTIRKPPNIEPLKQSPKQQRLHTIYKSLNFLKSSSIALLPN